MSNTASPQVQLIYELGRGFGEKNLDIVAKTFHRDSRHIAYPRSLNIPEQSGQEYLDFVGQRIRYWTEVEQPNIEIVADVPGKVVAHIYYKAKIASGASIAYESMLIAHIVTDDDGSLKMKKVEVFLDSKTQADLEAMGAASAGK